MIVITPDKNDYGFLKLLMKQLKVLDSQSFIQDTDTIRFQNTSQNRIKIYYTRDEESEREIAEFDKNIYSNSGFAFWLLGSIYSHYAEYLI